MKKYFVFLFLSLLSTTLKSQVVNQPREKQGSNNSELQDIRFVSNSLGALFVNADERIDTVYAKVNENITRINERIDALEAYWESEYNKNSQYAVDLGLSVKWASCNIGATSPEEYGNYFAWGETSGYNEGKKTFKWTTYQHCMGSYDKLTKYDPDIDGLKVLEPEDDAAHIIWGGLWRTPSVEEQEELINNCVWTWTTINGIKGCEFKSKINNNTIFLPATGYHSDKFKHVGSLGSYYASTCAGYYAFILAIHDDSVYISRDSARCTGRTIRAVCP